MDPDLVPIRSGTVFTDGMMPGAVPVNFVETRAPFSDGAWSGVVPPASEMSVMRTQMVNQQPPSQVLAPPNGARSAVTVVPAADSSPTWLPVLGLAFGAFLLLRRRR